MIPIHQLHYFLTVARTRSFTAAAAACRISQSAISQQIKALEDSLGVKVIARDPQGLSLTAAGELLYPAARKLLSHYEEFSHHLSHLSAAEAVPVALPLSWLASPLWQRIKKSWSAAFPRAPLIVHPHVIGAPPPPGCALIVTAATTTLPSRFQRRPLGRCRTTIAISEHLMLEDRGGIQPGELARLTLIIAAGTGPDPHQEAALAAALGRRPSLRLCRERRQALQQVAAAEGVLPLATGPGDHARNFKIPGIITLPLKPPLPSGPLIVAWDPAPLPEELAARICLNCPPPARP